MNKELKTLAFEVKNLDEETGIFEGYAATFSEMPDAYKDIIERGAFTKTLNERGNRIKILWHHDVREPIGKPLEIKEDNKGLWVKGKLSLGVQRAREVLHLMKDGVITELSIGYDAIKAPVIDGVRRLKEIALWDVSPVVFAANADALVMSVKEEKQGNIDALIDTWDSWAGSFTKCVEVLSGRPGITDPEALCAWLHNEAEGKWPTEAGYKPPERKQTDEALLVKTALNALQALHKSMEKEPEPDKSTPLLEVDREAVDMEGVLNGIEAELAHFDAKQAEARIDQILDKIKREVKTNGTKGNSGKNS